MASEKLAHKAAGNRSAPAVGALNVIAADIRVGSTRTIRGARSRDASTHPYGYIPMLVTAARNSVLGWREMAPQSRLSPHLQHEHYQPGRVCGSPCAGSGQTRTFRCAVYFASSRRVVTRTPAQSQQ